MLASNNLIDTLKDEILNSKQLTTKTSTTLLEITDAQLAAKAGKLISSINSENFKKITLGILSNCTTGNYQYLLSAKLAGIGVQARNYLNPYGMFDISLATADFAGGDQLDIVTCLIDESYFIPTDWEAVDIKKLENHLEVQLKALQNNILS